MRICVLGLWHLGSVTAACLAERYPTVGYDEDGALVRSFERGEPQVAEPGLAELLRHGLSSGWLSFTDDLAAAVDAADFVCVAIDSPIDGGDVADLAPVARQVQAILPHLKGDSLVLISSQVPVGFTARMESAFRSFHPDRSSVHFAYSPENLRLGNALAAFRHPDRIVVGIRSADDKPRLAELFAPFCRRLEWMSIESAEMSKHALNAFLATSLAFANEIARICEQTGADAKEVERGLKSDPRIGRRAYLSPGSAFAGGTLACDVTFLNHVGRTNGVGTPLLRAVRISNDQHKSWPHHKLEERLGSVTGKTVAVLGLTYKPGTDTLRRSSAVDLCLSLARLGAEVRAHDPTVKSLPSDLGESIRLCRTAHEAISCADAVVVATEWPAFRRLRADDLVGAMRQPIVIDPNRFLENALRRDPRLQYAAVGEPRRLR